MVSSPFAFINLCRVRLTHQDLEAEATEIQ